jgi:hypothetical protein
MLARLRHHVARVSPLPPGLQKHARSFMLLRTSRISGGTQYSEGCTLTCDIASDFTLFILQRQV